MADPAPSLEVDEETSSHSPLHGSLCHRRLPESTCDSNWVNNHVQCRSQFLAKPFALRSKAIISTKVLFFNNEAFKIIFLNFIFQLVPNKGKYLL